ncbi:hypothetical protein CHLNCDRAFT_51536 [Chlorella variabilis]|uniref:C2H2-type domain-containing protein n=1 Tax=Chlorella variabilis TaxID=554065 RepID=E1ZC74_CHLVA|nr:hypothetical protein CHLNCDRAFT_51536 [Chlorella variabilis]EFN56561.1 hypothetical protein CHLNCDRAFT_51536 [Chlorella variabilis]|eukprot:XP_005848663.1 hypothetical protein CHLNCDRAFT_51536 [Chlorella variabilis]
MPHATASPLTSSRAILSCALHVPRHPARQAQRQALAARTSARSLSPALAGRRRPAPSPAPAAGGGAEQADLHPQQQQQQQQDPLDWSNLQVTVEFVFTVQGCCTLRVHGRLPDPHEAGTAAVVAAALVNLHKRQRVLDVAVASARAQLPGALDAAMLKRFDELAAQGRQGAAMELLSFGQLRALCSRFAPELCAEVEEEILQQAALLKAQNMRPAPADKQQSSGAGRGTAEASSSGTASSSPGGGDAGTGSTARFKVRPGFDLPTEMVRLPRWQGWMRRLRDAVVAWQLEQHRAQKQAADAAAAAGSGSSNGSSGSSSDSVAASQHAAAAAAAAAAAPPPAPAAAAAEKAKEKAGLVTVTGAPSGSLLASFSTACTTPDGQPMRQEVRIAVAPPIGPQLLSKIREEPGWLSKLAVLYPGLMAAAATPERQLQKALEATAWHHIRLDPSCSFACTLHPGPEEAGSAEAAAGAAPSGAPQGGASDAAGFEFGGCSNELRALIYALAWLLDVQQEGDGEFSGEWVPKDGRIRLRWRGGGAGGGWSRPWSAPQQRGGLAASYGLRVWPPAPDGSTQLPAEAADDPRLEQEARTTELSQRQLDALLDCLDAFSHQHPGFVQLLLPEPLSAPPPRWRQRLAGLFRGKPAAGGSEEDDGASGGGGGAEQAEAGGGGAQPAAPEPWFYCDDCGDTIKKPKIAQHCNQCSASGFTCIDCSASFDRRSVQGHTQCVTEHEKYALGATKPGGYAAEGFAANGAAKPSQDGQAEGLEFLSSRPPWKCSICNVTCTSQDALMGHASGAKHKRRAKAALAAKDGGQQQEQAQPPAAADAATATAAASKEQPAVEAVAGELHANGSEGKKKRKRNKKGKAKEGSAAGEEAAQPAAEAAAANGSSKKEKKKSKKQKSEAAEPAAPAAAATEQIAPEGGKKKKNKKKRKAEAAEQEAPVKDQPAADGGTKKKKSKKQKAEAAEPAAPAAAAVAIEQPAADAGKKKKKSKQQKTEVEAVQEQPAESSKKDKRKRKKQKQEGKAAA